MGLRTMLLSSPLLSSPLLSSPLLSSPMLSSLLLSSFGALTLLLSTISAPALAQGGSGGSDPSDRDPRGVIGIKLLEASANRRDDPRAYLYIVDHINPGSKISRRFEIENTSSSPQRIAVYPGAAEIRDGKFVPSPERDANELSSWVSINRTELVAPPHSHIPLKATITIPQTATKGERYGAIFAEATSPAAPGAARNVQMVNRVGIRIYLDVGPGGDPPSDFRIDRLTPGRTADGMPVVQAAVHNTGQRALDISGQMRLSEGPGGLGAGPFPAQLGTTLALNASAPVAVVLDERLPDGPWKVELLLESGRVHRTVTATLLFPGKPASWGIPALIDSSWPWILIIGLATTVVATLVLALCLFRRRRTRLT
ncbi:hypothetical protein AB0L53_45405 [Nonomuraea sp. NPDC052129]|uniref:hypothetical protein n=1 Tax=Nonomuraea sp. NPDC052129 TaxID=3154651 RepID=UPI003447009C